MGKPKHGKDSARTRKCKKYKDEGRLFLNKKKKEEKIAAGTYHKRHLEKTWDMKVNTILRNAKQTKPVVDTNTGVIWGTNVEDEKSVARALKKINKNKNKKKAA